MTENQETDLLAAVPAAAAEALKGRSADSPPLPTPCNARRSRTELLASGQDGAKAGDSKTAKVKKVKVKKMTKKNSFYDSYYKDEERKRKRRERRRKKKLEK